MVIGRMTPPKLVLSAGILLVNWAADRYLNVQTGFKAPAQAPKKDTDDVSYSH
jgi:hypothetical protein